MQRLSVLIIEDQKNGWHRSLPVNGERTERCALEDALGCLSRVRADAVVLDCGNRVWTGLSTMSQIKKTYPDIPVIFLTDMSSEDAAINSMKMGAYKYFEKPVKAGELEQTVELLLSIKRAANGHLVPGTGEKSDPVTKLITSDMPKNILEAIAFIKENLWSPLELEGLAEQVHLSKFHFCRIFKRHVGMNPMKYVAAMRIENAKKLLKKDDLTISEVANEVGFRDMSNFIRQFKKVTGVPPRTYRNTARVVVAPDGQLSTSVDMKKRHHGEEDLLS